MNRIYAKMIRLAGDEHVINVNENALKMRYCHGTRHKDFYRIVKDYEGRFNIQEATEFWEDFAGLQVLTGFEDCSCNDAVFKFDRGFGLETTRIARGFKSYESARSVVAGILMNSRAVARSKKLEEEEKKRKERKSIVYRKGRVMRRA